MVVKLRILIQFRRITLLLFVQHQSEKERKKNYIIFIYWKPTNMRNMIITFLLQEDHLHQNPLDDAAEIRLLEDVQDPLSVREQAAECCDPAQANDDT